MIKNVLMGISYLGTNYAGWQRQDNALAVQEVIENAISLICGHFIEVFASGRTDSGVHAYEQCVSFQIDFADINKLPLAINSKLPTDIRVLWAKEVPDDFHARFSAHKKTYLYRVKTATIESPFDEAITTYVPYTLSLAKMQEASKFLVGEHDFEAFCSSGATVPDYVRTIYNIDIRRSNNLFEFEICGSGFLYNMVRIMVGTLIDVGRSKIEPSDVQKILNSKKRQNAGKTMPAKGLILKNVEY